MKQYIPNKIYFDFNIYEDSSNIKKILGIN